MPPWLAILLGIIFGGALLAGVIAFLLEKLAAADIPEAEPDAHADDVDGLATKRDILYLDAKIDRAVRDLTIRAGGMLLVAVAVLAAIRFFG